MTGSDIDKTIKIGDSGMYIRCESVGDTEWTKKISDSDNSDTTNNDILNGISGSGEGAIVGTTLLGLIFLIISYSFGQYIFKDMPNEIIKEKIYNSKF